MGHILEKRNLFWETLDGWYLFTMKLMTSYASVRAFSETGCRSSFLLLRGIMYI